MRDDHIIQCLKESLPGKVKPQLLEIDDTDIPILKTSVLVPLFKAELLQKASSSMLVYMTDHTPQNDEANKCSKPGLCHKVFCKVGRVPEDLTRITSKTSSSVVSVTEHLQQRDFKGEKTPQFAVIGGRLGYQDQSQTRNFSQSYGKYQNYSNTYYHWNYRGNGRGRHAGNYNRCVHCSYCNVNDRRYINYQLDGNTGQRNSPMPVTMCVLFEVSQNTMNSIVMLLYINFKV